MSSEHTTQFIDRLEQLAQGEEAKTKAVSYQLINKVVPMKNFLDSLVKDARHYLHYGDWLIALENTISNMYETDIKLDKDILDIARKAFGEHLKEYDWQQTLDEMTKKADC
jgi:proline dehydrogenase